MLLEDVSIFDNYFSSESSLKFVIKINNSYRYRHFELIYLVYYTNLAVLTAQFLLCLLVSRFSLCLRWGKYSLIKQIYHVWEGKFFVSLLVFFANTPPKHDISVQYSICFLFFIVFCTFFFFFFFFFFFSPFLLLLLLMLCSFICLCFFSAGVTLYNYINHVLRISHLCDILRFFRYWQSSRRLFGHYHNMWHNNLEIYRNPLLANSTNAIKTLYWLSNPVLTLILYSNILMYMTGVVT